MAHIKILFQKTSTHWGRCVKGSCDSMCLSHATTWLCLNFPDIGHGKWIVPDELIAGFCDIFIIKIFLLYPSYSSSLHCLWSGNPTTVQLIIYLFSFIKIYLMYLIQGMGFWFFFCFDWLSFYYDASVFQFREFSTIL